MKAMAVGGAIHLTVLPYTNAELSSFLSLWILNTIFFDNEALSWWSNLFLVAMQQAVLYILKMFHLTGTMPKGFRWGNKYNNSMHYSTMSGILIIYHDFEMTNVTFASNRAAGQDGYYGSGGAVGIGLY